MMFPNRYALISTCAMATLAMSCGPGDSGKTKAEKASATAGPAAVTKASAAAIDPCALLTKADAVKILGAPVKDGQVSEVGTFAPGNQCLYLTSTPIEEAGGVWSVSVDVFDQATFDKRSSYFKSPALAFHRDHKAMKSGDNSDLVDVNDVGEAAFWSGQHLYVLDRGVELVLTVRADFHIPPGPREKVYAEVDAAALKASTDLAKTVILPRLENL